MSILYLLVSIFVSIFEYSDQDANQRAGPREEEVSNPGVRRLLWQRRGPAYCHQVIMSILYHYYPRPSQKTTLPFEFLFQLSGVPPGGILKSSNQPFSRSFDIIASIENLRARGMEFLNIPDSYYNVLRKRLAKSPVKVTNYMLCIVYKVSTCCWKISYLPKV